MQNKQINVIENIQRNNAEIIDILEVGEVTELTLGYGGRYMEGVRRKAEPDTCTILNR